MIDTEAQAIVQSFLSPVLTDRNPTVLTTFADC